MTAYLEFDELQALNHNPKTMANWITKLDDFLKLSDREILDHAGKFSHAQAKGKAEAEYEIYQRQQAALPQPVDEHFETSLEELKHIEKRMKEREDEGTDATECSCREDKLSTCFLSLPSLVKKLSRRFDPWPFEFFPSITSVNPG